MLFTRQLATMVDAGLPLVSVLTALYEQADPKKQAGLRRVVGEVSALVQQGDSFYEAISKHPRIFSRLYVAMVKAGESGGLLAEILDRLAAFLEAAARLKKKVKSAMTYPVIVICIAFAITTFLIVKVVPVFGDIFADFGANLPGTDPIPPRSLRLHPGLLVYPHRHHRRRHLRRPRLRPVRDAAPKLWDQWKLKLPIFGPLVHKICMTRFARTFAQLIRAGVPILEVMDIVGDTSGNYVVAEAIKGVAPTSRKATTSPPRSRVSRSSRRCSSAWSAPVNRPARSTRCSRRWRTSGTRKSKRSSTRSPHSSSRS